MDSGYCHAPCSYGSETCQQLAAGCGASLWDIAETDYWGSQKCDRQKVASGECGLCREPLWCDDPSPFGYDGAVKEPGDWMERFYHQDGPPFVHEQGASQCKWKRNQKQAFIDTMRAHYLQRKEENLNDWYFGTLWNEVNMYVGPGDDEIEQTLWDSLLGLVFVRNTGNDQDLHHIRTLAAHIKSLGRDKT